MVIDRRPQRSAKGHHLRTAAEISTRRRWFFAPYCDRWWKLVSTFRAWNEMAEYGMAPFAFSIKKEGEDSAISCEGDLFYISRPNMVPTVDHMNMNKSISICKWFKSYICVLYICMSITHAVLNCWSVNLLGYTYKSCGSTVQLALLTLHLLSHFICGLTVISKWDLEF